MEQELKEDDHVLPHSPQSSVHVEMFDGSAVDDIERL